MFYFIVISAIFWLKYRIVCHVNKMASIGLWELKAPTWQWRNPIQIFENYVQKTRLQIKFLYLYIVLTIGVRQFAFILQAANLSPQKQKKYKYRQPPTYAVVTLRKFRRESNFAQIEFKYAYFGPCVHKIVGPTHWNLIDRSTVAPPPVLSLSSILLIFHLVVISFAQGRTGRAF